MSAKIHHLDCGTMCPFGGGLVSGEGLFSSAKMVAHCLLVERENGLLLVDTGFGLDDVRSPAERLGRAFLSVTRPVLDPEETAVRQIRRLGLDPRDVRDVVVTHLDLDHAGGLPDFPEARVHVFYPEYEAALRPPTSAERRRYRPAHFAHGPRWEAHRVEGESWSGFEAVRVLGDDVLLVPLVGHTRGHSAVAVRDGDRWLLHCGDAYFHHGELADPPYCPPGLRVFQATMSVDDRARVRNQDRLRALVREKKDVFAFSAHSPVELSRMREAGSSVARSAG
jgi:glyoxylase-like metal-dependent hydrolase (beta-lactamase superfamily II)